MVTNRTRRQRPAEGQTVESALAWAAGRLGQLFCGMRGHDPVLHFERNRLTTRCTSCGHETPGWEIGGTGPQRRYDGDARRHLLTTRRLVLRKSA
jgi:hypothetical protein